MVCYRTEHLYQWSGGSIHVPEREGLLHCLHHLGSYWAVSSRSRGKVAHFANAIRKRIFSPGEIYSVMQWYWLLGALLPVCTYALARKWPRSIAKYDFTHQYYIIRLCWHRTRYIHVPLMLGGTGWIPPATVYIYLCCAYSHFLWLHIHLTANLGGMVGTIFNFFIKRRWRGWWMQYVSGTKLCFLQTLIVIELYYIRRSRYRTIYIHDLRLLLSVPDPCPCTPVVG